MKYPYSQGWLDSMCGIYSLVNADRIINKSTEDESQNLFNEIILYLSKKRKLKEILLGGVYHKDMRLIMLSLFKNKYNWQVMGNGFLNISDWWNKTQEFLNEKNSTVILSIGGRENHLTVIESMTDKTMKLFDSSYMTKIRKSNCRLYGYTKDDKFIIYPTQSFFCWKI